MRSGIFCLDGLDGGTTFEGYEYGKVPKIGNVLSGLPHAYNEGDGICSFRFRGKVIRAKVSDRVMDVLAVVDEFSSSRESILREVAVMSRFHGNFISENYRPTAVGILVDNESGKVLIARSKKGSWHFPQGGVGIMNDTYAYDSDYAVESPILTIKRELKEELGVSDLERHTLSTEVGSFGVRAEYKPGRRLKVDSDVGTGRSVTWFSGKEYVTVFFEVNSSGINLAPDEDEISDVNWVGAEELSDYGVNLDKTGYPEVLTGLLGR